MTGEFFKNFDQNTGGNFSGKYIRWLWNCLRILKASDKPKSWQMRFGVTKILTNYKVAYKQKIKYVDIEARVRVLGLKKVQKGLNRGAYFDRR
jgi:hypothetical protein